MTTKLAERQIKSLIKESVREAINTEFMKLRSLLVPEVSKKEQKDIETRYGKPKRRASQSEYL